MLIWPTLIWSWSITKFINGLLPGSKMGQKWLNYKSGQLAILVFILIIPSWSKVKWKKRHSEETVNLQAFHIFLPLKLCKLLPLSCLRNSMISAKCIDFKCLIQRVSASSKAL